MKYWHPEGTPENCSCLLCTKYVTDKSFKQVADGIELINGVPTRIGGNIPTINYAHTVIPIRLPLHHEKPCEKEGSAIDFCTNCHKDLSELKHIRHCTDDNHTFCVRGDIEIRQSVFEEKIDSCYHCKDYVAMKTSSLGRNLKWAYGITTIPERKNTYFGRTLESLRESGFTNPWLFIDGCSSSVAELYKKQYELEVTTRFPNLTLYGNWLLGMWELYLRNPHADRYAMFQDDIIVSRNLKKYLETVEYINKGYQNLYTFPENEIEARKQGVTNGWFKSNQMGKGAVALVFDRETLITLLSTRHMAARIEDLNRGKEVIDGAVVEALNRFNGWTEYCHVPSLCQHIGDKSSHGDRTYKKSETFKGEEFDLMELLKR